jgi:hypothetical protein
VSGALICQGSAREAGAVKFWLRENGGIRRRSRILKWCATVDEDGQYSFAVAL